MKTELLSDISRLAVTIKDAFFVFAPQLISAAFILLAGWLLANFGRWAISRLAIGLGRILPSEREKPSAFLSKGLQPVATVLGQIMYWLILFIFVAATAERMGLSVVADWMKLLSIYAPRLFAAVLIAFVGWQASQVTRQLLSGSAAVSQWSQAALLTDLICWSINVVTALVAIHQVGIDIGILSNLLLVLFAVFSGGAALALALGFRKTAENVLGTFHLKKNLQPGQRVKIDDIEGVITHISGTDVFIENEQGEWKVPGTRFSTEASLKVKKNS